MKLYALVILSLVAANPIPQCSNLPVTKPPAKKQPVTVGPTVHIQAGPGETVQVQVESGQPVQAELEPAPKPVPVPSMESPEPKGRINNIVRVTSSLTTMGNNGYYIRYTIYCRFPDGTTRIHWIEDVREQHKYSWVFEVKKDDLMWAEWDSKNFIFHFHSPDDIH